MTHLLPPRPVIVCVGDTFGCLAAEGTRRLDFADDFHLSSEAWSLLQEVNWRADFIAGRAGAPPPAVPNDLLTALRTSQVYGVSETWRTEGRAGAPSPAAGMSSAALLLSLMLDRLTHKGEGVLRLDEAAYAALPRSLRAHLWAVLEERGASSSVLLFFARDHTSGVQGRSADPGALSRFHHRKGARVECTAQACPSTVATWQAAAAEWRRRSAPGATPHTWYLAGDGTIGVRLSAWDRLRRPDLVRTAEEFRGQPVAQAVLQREPRERLLYWLAQCDTHPELLACVQRSAAALDAVSAPLMPLPPGMRLGWMEHHEVIRCRKEFQLSAFSFQPSHSYPLHTALENCSRRIERPNLRGQPETIELVGYDLCFFVRDAGGREVCFSSHAPVRALACPRLPLARLLEHFHIEDVPDQAARQPEAYERNLQQLNELTAPANDPSSGTPGLTHETNPQREPALPAARG